MRYRFGRFRTVALSHPVTTQSAETSLTPPLRLLSLLIPVAIPSHMSVGRMQCAKVYSTLGMWRDRGSRTGSEMFAPTPWIFDFSSPTTPLNSHFSLSTFDFPYSVSVGNRFDDSVSDGGASPAF